MMVYNRTFCIVTTNSWTRIYAFVITTGSVTITVVVNGALRFAAGVRVSEIFWYA